MEWWFAYLLLGAFAGLVAGLLGVGGGLIIVPALTVLFQQGGMAPTVLVHTAIGTSLATIVITSLSSTYAHHCHGAVLWRVWAQLLPGIVVGAWLGSTLADALPGGTLRAVFGVFELLVAVQMGLALRPRPHRQLPHTPGVTAAGGVIGAVSAVVGIGGGTLTVPFLSWCNVAIHRAVATSAATGLPIAVAGAVGYGIAGWDHADVPVASTGYVYWPALAGIAATSVLLAPVGARLAHRLPATALKRVFAVFLAGLGVYMVSGY